MTLRLRDRTPTRDRLKPAATDAELRWFRQKRLRAIGRSVLLSVGMGGLFFVGSLLRDPAHAHHERYLFEIGSSA